MKSLIFILFVLGISINSRADAPICSVTSICTIPKSDICYQGKSECLADEMVNIVLPLYRDGTLVRRFLIKCDLEDQAFTRSCLATLEKLAEDAAYLDRRGACVFLPY